MHKMYTHRCTHTRVHRHISIYTHTYKWHGGRGYAGCAPLAIGVSLADVPLRIMVDVMQPMASLPRNAACLCRVVGLHTEGLPLVHGLALIRT